MDFESLARFILHTARSNTDQAVTSIDELILAIEENYIPVDLELKKIGYEFKNCRELITFIKFLKYLIET
ncbi:TPA: ATP-binding protein, partial [Streptococcus equi subsp. zooepidemicus]|nr:ATP-binding protein [Streptococcus equi subsp. zooepidemicus]